ncbi:protein kinase domain-containing protein [Actinomadura luzonensis]|uniref:protein kinase domain-containing protein n=1 Tax=Actinomadura luzonensis TaxID=2805427 RepID=UPI0027E2FDA0|nr:protein kinase [Actinomadura luzonensis]
MLPKGGRPAVRNRVVINAGVHDGRPYIVSEYVQGPSLDQLVRREGPRSPDSLVRLAIATAAALNGIHQAGIVHRDFKPANVLLAPDGPRARRCTSRRPASRPSTAHPSGPSRTSSSTPTRTFAWFPRLFASSSSRPCARPHERPPALQLLLLLSR